MLDRDPSRFYVGDRVEVEVHPGEWKVRCVESVVGTLGEEIEIESYDVCELAGGRSARFPPHRVRPISRDRRERGDADLDERAGLEPKLRVPASTKPIDPMAEFRRDFASRALLLMLDNAGTKLAKVCAAVEYADLLIAELAKPRDGDE